MLVLRRKPDEAVVLNGEITVTVLAVEGNRVKVGIDAPAAVTVVRLELLNADRQQVQLCRLRARLERETDPREREKLARSVERLEQSIAQMPQASAPANPEMQQEERRERVRRREVTEGASNG
jgi:carbon storage regulator